MGEGNFYRERSYNEPLERNSKVITSTYKLTPGPFILYLSITHQLSGWHKLISYP
jgi:hypothetical protein